MVELLTSPWRPTLRELLSSVQRDMLIASPYIKKSEAEWVCEVLRSAGSVAHLRLQILTDVRSDSVLSGSLDIEALRTFTEAIPNASVVNLPRLHAKAYVADTDFAIVGSGNLTPSGLETNYEYGVALRDPAIVAQIRSDLEDYAHVGNRLAAEVLGDLVVVGRELADEYQQFQRSAKANLRRRFTQKLRSANYEFLRAQVGADQPIAFSQTPLSTFSRKDPLELKNYIQGSRSYCLTSATTTSS